MLLRPMMVITGHHFFPTTLALALGECLRKAWVSAVWQKRVICIILFLTVLVHVCVCVCLSASLSVRMCVTKDFCQCLRVPAVVAATSAQSSLYPCIILQDTIIMSRPLVWLLHTLSAPLKSMEDERGVDFHDSKILHSRFYSLFLPSLTHKIHLLSLFL